MSVNTVERVLWEINDDPEKLEAFLKDRDAYLARFPLSEEEFRMVRAMDVAAFDAYGVSNMLSMMAYSSVNGNNPITMFDYLTKLNHGNLENNFRLPGPLFNILRFLVWVKNGVQGAMSLVGLRKSYN